MKIKLIAFSIIVLELLAVTGIALAQTGTIGVSKGETFDYNYSLIWTSTNPTATPPNEYIELNKTQSIQLRVTETLGSKVSLEKITTLKDGTKNTESGYVDINTGTIAINYGSLIVSANLNTNDKLYPSGGSAIISDTSTRTYPSSQRETNHYISETTNQQYYEKAEIYFDKQKGIATNYNYESRETSDGNTATTKEVLTNTNSDVWAVGSGPSGTPMPSQSTTTGSYPANTGPSPTTTVNQAPLGLSNLLPIVLIILVVVIVLVSVLMLRGKGKKKSSNVDEEFKQYLKKQ